MCPPSGLVLPSGSLIFRFTRALFFIPMILSRVRMALAVLPIRPMIFPISAGFTVRLMSTPISSTVRSIFTSFGLSTKALTTYSKNSLSASCINFLYIYFRTRRRLLKESRSFTTSLHRYKYRILFRSFQLLALLGGRLFGQNVDFLTLYHLLGHQEVVHSVGEFGAFAHPIL